MSRETKNIQERFSNKMSLMSVICAILVIMIHVCNIEVYEFSGPLYWTENLISLNIAEMAVPFFFMSSAFFQYSKERTTKAVYCSKCKSLVIPYLLWNTISLISYFILRKLGLSQFGMAEFNLREVFEGIFFYQSNLVFWFMYQMILLNLLYPVFRYILQKGKIISLVVNLLMILCYELFGEISFYHNYWILSLTSTIYFFTGAFIGAFYKEEIVNSINWKKTARILMFVIAIAICVFDFAESNIWKIHGMPSIKIFKNFAAITALFIALDWKKDFKENRLASITFMIYAMHSLILEAVEKLIYLLLPHTVLFAAIDYFMAPVIVLVIIYMVCWFMKKRMPRIYAVLSGKRTKSI